MKTYVLIYKGFADFEMVIAGLIMKSQGEVITVGVTDEPVISEGGLKCIPHMLLSEVNTDDVDLFIVPGGNPEPVLEEKELSDFIKELDEKKKVIGAICAGPIHLAKAGILGDKKFTTAIPKGECELFNEDNRIDEDVVVDENIITATGNAYVEFAIEIGKVMDVYEDEDDLQETIEFFKNVKK